MNLFDDLEIKLKNQVMLLNAGLSLPEATRIAFEPAIKQELIRVEGALFDELIKFAFLSGRLYGVRESHEIAIPSEGDAIRDCQQKVNKML